MMRSRNLPALRLSDTANLWIAAFAIAFIAWVFAKTAATEVAVLDVPVTSAATDPRVEVRISPASVRVTVRYPKSLEPYISSANFKFLVDIADMRNELGHAWTAKTLPLSERQWSTSVKGANRIELVQIGQGSNTVKVEARWNAQPAVVQPVIVGVEKLKAGLQLATPVRVLPREVWLTGAPDALATVPRDEETSRLQVPTEPINVAGKTQTTLETVRLQLPPGVDVVGSPSRSVEVSLDIQEVHTIREIKGVRIAFEAVSPESIRLDYSPTTATVTVYGPASALQQIVPESLEIVPVRPAEEVPGTTKEVPLEARWAPSISEELRTKLQIRSVEPKSVQVHYKPRETPAAE